MRAEENGTLQIKDKPFWPLCFSHWPGLRLSGVSGSDYGVLRGESDLIPSAEYAEARGEMKTGHKVLVILALSVYAAWLCKRKGSNSHILKVRTSTFQCEMLQGNSLCDGIT